MKKNIPTETINVAEITRELLGLIMKLPGSERAELLETLKPEILHQIDATSTSAVTTALIDTVMKLDTQERCRIMGELKATDGSSKRKYGRINFFSPIQYVIHNQLRSGFIKNISGSGMFLEDPHYTGPEIKLGQTVLMTFEHPYTGSHKKINGEIVRITKAGLGIRFAEKI